MNERRRFLQVIGGGAVAAGMGCTAGDIAGFTSGSGTGGSGAGGGAGSVGTGGGTSSSGGAGGSASSSSAGAGGVGGVDAGTVTASSTGTGTTCGGGGASSNGVNSDYCESARGVFNVGKPSDYPTPGLYKVSNVASNVMIGRDANGLYAISSLCTHQCCDMNASQSGFAYGTFTTSNGQKVIQCNCHGSAFAYDGAVVRGPAGTPLQSYQLDLGCDGVLYADTSKPVAKTQRLDV